MIIFCLSKEIVFSLNNVMFNMEYDFASLDNSINMTADLAIQVMLTVQIMSCCIEIIDHNSSLTMEIL